jgi:hypothetical protein
MDTATMKNNRQKKSPRAGKNELIPLVQYFFYCLKYSPSASQGQGQSGIDFSIQFFIQHRASADSSLSLEPFLMSL